MGHLRTPVKLRFVFAAYALVAVVVTYPLVLSPLQHVIGVSLPPGEAVPPLNIWAMHTVLSQLFRDPLHLFDGTAFYPYARTVTMSEHLLAPALLGAPVAWLTGNLVLAYNVVMLLTLALAGLGMYLLAREVGGDGPAFVAGLFYAFHSWNVNETVRLQILSNQWFPFLLWALMRFFKQPTGRSAALASLFYLLQSLSCMYWGLYAPLLIAASLAFLQWRERLPWRALGKLAFAFAPALLLVGLSVVPYLQTSRELGLERSTPNPLLLERYLQVLPNNWLYGGLLGTARSNENAAHFLGFASLLLAALGALSPGAADARFKRFKPFLLFLVAFGFVLSLGPVVQVGRRVLFDGPYELLFGLVPGFKNTRYPERFSIFLVLGLGPLVAMGLARVRPWLGRTGLVLVAILVPLEHLAVPLSLSSLESGARIPSVYRWLKDQDDIHVIAEVPSVRHLMERADARLMYLSTIHGKRTVEGFTGYFPPTYPFAKWRLFHFPDAGSVAFLERFGVDAVVVRPENGATPAWTRGDPRWQLFGPFPEGHVVLRLGKRQPFAAPPADWEAFAEIPRHRYGVSASSPGAERAADDEPATTWSPGRRRDNWYRISFDEPQPLTRIAIRLDHNSEFPIGLKLFGRKPDSRTRPVHFDKPAALDRLFSSLLFEPRNPVLVVDFEARELASISLEIGRPDPFGMPWSMSEIRLYAPR